MIDPDILHAVLLFINNRSNLLFLYMGRQGAEGQRWPLLSSNTCKTQGNDMELCQGRVSSIYMEPIYQEQVPHQRMVGFWDRLLGTLIIALSCQNQGESEQYS